MVAKADPFVELVTSLVIRPDLTIRIMIKRTIAMMIILFAGFNSRSQSTNSFPESKLGWKLGVQSYTFKEFTFYEAMSKIDTCNVKYIECYSSMRIGGGVEGEMDYKMDDATMKVVKAWLRDRGFKIASYGVMSVNSNEEWLKLFEFGKKMGIETFTIEPDKKFVPYISQLCDKFKINAAIHNHAVPNFYWNPEVVLSVIKGHSKRLGVCADIGHWVRSGLDPVESLRKLEGHVLAMHMKDLNEKGNREAHDVIWGQGVCNIKGVADELKRQGFKGMISAEYEYNWHNNASDVKRSIEYLRSVL